MSNDPYAAPQANLDTSGEIISSGLWKASGRLSVLSYWAHAFVLTLVFALIAGILVAIVGMLSGGFETVMSGGEPEGPGLIVGMVIGIPVFLALMWISWCMLIKRLHDRNHSGWLSLLFLVPLVNLIFSIYALFFPGHKTSNRYGAPRPTKGWEKIVGIIFLLVYALSMVFAIVGPMIGMSAGL